MILVISVLAGPRDRELSVGDERPQAADVSEDVISFDRWWFEGSQLVLLPIERAGRVHV